MSLVSRGWCCGREVRNISSLTRRGVNVVRDYLRRAVDEVVVNDVHIDGIVMRGHVLDAVVLRCVGS